MNKLVKKSCFAILMILTLSTNANAKTDIGQQIEELMVKSYLIGCVQALPFSEENYRKCEEKSEKFRTSLNTPNK